MCGSGQHRKIATLLKKTDKDDLILEGFGIHVPDEVLEAHGMKPLRVDREHELLLHMSQQLDGPFLLEQTGSLRAKAIGRISGAHFLDMAIRETSRDVSQIRQRLKHEEEEIESVKQQLVPFAPLDRYKQELNRATEKLQSLKASKVRLEQLKDKKQRWIISSRS